MGISIQEYLAGREPCDVCQELGDQHQCVTAMLSRLDTCLIFNCVFLNQTDQTANDVMLLQNLRSQATPQVVLDYYVRAEPVTKRINHRLDRDLIYHNLYGLFVKDLLNDLRNQQHDQSLTKLCGLIDHAEKYF